MVPLLIALFTLQLAGVALMVSVLNVVYRDVAYLVQTGLYILYWLTPVIYPLERIPYPYKLVLQCNPVGAIITAMRGAIMDGHFPTLLGWASLLVPTALLFGLGWAVFRHYERMVLDYV